MTDMESFDPMLKENNDAKPMPKDCGMCKGSKKFADPKRKGRVMKCPKCGGRGYHPTK